MSKNTIWDEILKDKTRYDGFIGAPTRRSDFNNKSYPLIFPLSTPGINSTLAFTKSNSTWDPDRGMIIGSTNDPMQGSLFFTRPATIPSANLPSPLKVFDPTLGMYFLDVDTNAYGHSWSTTPPWCQGANQPCSGSAKDCCNSPSLNSSTDMNLYSSNANIKFGDYTVDPLNIFYQSQGLWNDTKQHGFYFYHNPTTNFVELADPVTTNVVPTSANYKWRTDQEAVGCCSASADYPSLKDMCAPAFMPGNAGGSYCQDLMLKVCQDNWEGAACSAYLQSFKYNNDVPIVVARTVRNYINGQAARSGCGANDYTSPLVQGADACRDDSKDPFISQTMINLCTAVPGACDDILDQYCAEFSKDDLAKDPTLQTLCGCHLSVTNSQIPPPGGLKLRSDWKSQPNQYIYPDMPKACDPICAYSNTIQYADQQCSQTVCVMDNINIQEMNSDCGVTINQVCGQGKSGQGVGNCFISSVDVNLINSSCGQSFINQNCGSCWTFNPGTSWDGSTPANAKRVDCNSLTGGGGTGPGGGGSSGGSTAPGRSIEIGEWIKEHPFYVAGIAMLFVFIIFIILMLTV